MSIQKSEMKPCFLYQILVQTYLPWIVYNIYLFISYELN